MANICECSEGWAGDDCSVSDVELRNHIPVTSTVATRKWKYFHFLANSLQQSVEFQVNQTSSEGDIDTYVRLGQYPGRGVGEYDMRDISTSRNARFEIQRPSGVYYIGVYGFIGAEFKVMATLKSSCPNDCSGHGSCSFDGVCTCSSGFIGADCSQAVTTLSSGSTVSSSVGLRQWKYFKTQSTHNTLTIQVNQANADDDADIYVKFNAAPNLTSFDFRDTGVTQSTELKINDAKLGTYYIGIYGFTEGTQFTIKATSFSECPNQCSGPTHGSCSNMFTCFCNSGYDGNACETKNTPMTLDAQIESGFVSGNMWNYYRFDSYTDSNIQVSLHQTETANSDCDVYIKQSQNPTRFDFDYRDIGYTQDIGITIENPSLASWYVGIYGYRPCTYQLSALITQRCPNDCTDQDHGTCNNGHCVCKDNWTGDDCSYRRGLLTNGVAVTGNIAPGEWVYYTFSARAGSPITIALAETSSTGYVWLYESFSGNPTLNSYDSESSEINTSLHRNVIRVPADGYLNIGVYGSILGHSGSTYEFSVVAYQNTL